MKRIFRSKVDKKSQEAKPSAVKTGPQQPTAHDPTSDPGTGPSSAPHRAATEQVQETQEGGEQPDGVIKRSHADAVTARREPVQAPRSQDRDPTANHGVTITTEGGKPVAHPGSSLR